MICQNDCKIDLECWFTFSNHEKTCFSKGGTCSAIFVGEAKVEHVPLFLLKAEVELVPQDYKNCKIFTCYPSNEVNYISKFIKMKENLFLIPILCQKVTFFAIWKSSNGGTRSTLLFLILEAKVELVPPKQRWNLFHQSKNLPFQAIRPTKLTNLHSKLKQVILILDQQ